MNCSRVQVLISAFHDDELSDAVRHQMAEHLHGCGTCAQELAHFERMSQVTWQLDSPDVPARVWDRIETELRRPMAARIRPVRRWARPAVRGVALAGSILIVVGIGLSFRGEPSLRLQGNGKHDVEVNLARYARQFYLDPRIAQSDLLAEYANREVTPGEAEERLKYRPILAETLPGGFVRQELRLVEMPCCTCVQAVYRKNESDVLATFQQLSDESFEFEGCDELTCKCGCIDTRIVEVDGGVSASWRMNGTHVTLVGPRDMQQVVETIASFVELTDREEE
jgi:hypothetical protein